MTDFLVTTKLLTQLNACEPAIQWFNENGLEGRPWQEAWRACKTPTWLVWFATRVAYGIDVADYLARKAVDNYKPRDMELTGDILLDAYTIASEQSHIPKYEDSPVDFVYALAEVMALGGNCSDKGEIVGYFYGILTSLPDMVLQQLYEYEVCDQT